MVAAAGLATLLVKITAVLALGLVVLRLGGHRSAGVRHAIALTTLVAAAVVSLSGAWLPAVPVFVATQPAAGEIATTNLGGLTAADDAIAVSRSRRLTTRRLAWGGWLAGVAFCLFPMATATYQSRRIRRDGQPWRVLDATLPTVTGLRTISVPVLLHGDLSSPVACGLVSPFIAMPPSARGWRDDDVERALVHELAHLRRADMLGHAIARTICALYWFHPLAWTCWRVLRLEAERACDDAVLTTFEPADYASQLVRIARGTPSGVSAVFPAMARRGELSVRVQAILDSTRRRTSPGRRATALAAGATLTAAAWLGCLTPTTTYATSSASSASLAFTSVSVRDSLPTESMALMRRPDGSVRITAASLRTLIRLAHGVQDHAIVDAPSWAASARFSIEATARGYTTPDDTLAMLRALLADRFGLRLAHESRLQPVIVLGLSTGADGLRPPTPCVAATDSSTDPARVIVRLPRCGFEVRPGLIRATGVDAQALAHTMSMALDARVVIEPVRTDRVDMELRWPPASHGTQPLIDALQSQLGATVIQRERQMPVVVVRSVNRPQPQTRADRS